MALNRALAASVEADAPETDEDSSRSSAAQARGAEEAARTAAAWHGSAEGTEKRLLRIPWPAILLTDPAGWLLDANDAFLRLAGLTREELQHRYDDIVAFAELDEFMDLPMRTYSSGMYSRLAFAVAVHMEPDILLVDEALSAGDAKFRRRASAKMKELMGQARTIFLVSHALGSVIDLCNDAMFLQDGKLVARGAPQKIVDLYTESVDVKQDHLSMEEL